MSTPGDYAAVRKDIISMLKQPGYDDGSIGPILVRLAWHASGTYDKVTKTGGSNGATMRFAPESTDGANAGLENARLVVQCLLGIHSLLAIVLTRVWFPQKIHGRSES